MKKMAAFLIGILLVYCLGACALAEWEAVIANPSVADRLNLRQGPGTEEKSLGRFYSGTPVTVYEEDENGWARVRIGTLQGYMQAKYLMKMNRNYGAPSLFHQAWPVMERITLKSGTDQKAEAVAATRDFLLVLGDVGDDWRYVRLWDREQYGYVRTSQLMHHQILIEQAYMVPVHGEEADVYQDKEMTRKAGRFYSGAAVRVTGFSRNGGWALVESRAGTEALPGGWGLRGYVKLKDLQVFMQPWQVINHTLSGVALADIHLPAPVDITIPKGAALAVIGDSGDAYQILYGDASGTEYYGALVSSELVHVTGTYASPKGAGRIGYAYIPPKVDEEGYTLGTEILPISGTEPGSLVFSAPLVELLAENQDFVQVRQNGSAGFFVQRDQCTRILLEEELHRAQNMEVGPGSWVAREEESGLWYLTVEKQAQAVLTLKNEGDFQQDERYEIPAGRESAASYTVYIAPGTQVTLTGDGVLRPLDENAPVLVAQEGAPDYPEDQILFSGSGRFFCDAQIADRFDFFEYSIVPSPGAENPYVRYTNLFTESQEEGDTISLLQPGQESFAVAPGEFIELHECMLRINYGNG